LDNALKLAFGQTADDPIAELVRTWLSLTKRLKENEARCQKLAVRLAGTPPTIQSLNIPPEHHDEEKERLLLSKMQHDWEADAFTKLAEVEDRLKPLFSLPEWEAEKKLADSNDAEAFAYFKERDYLRARLTEENPKVLLQWRAAFETNPVEWFGKLASAVAVEVAADGKDAYPLHAALMMLARLRPAKTVNGVPVFEVGCAVHPGLPYTIDQLPRILKKRTGRKYDKAQIWRALAVLGLKPKGKPNPKSSRRKSKIHREIQKLPKEKLGQEQARHLSDQPKEPTLALLEAINPKTAATIHRQIVRGVDIEKTIAKNPKLAAKLRGRMLDEPS